MRASIPQVTIDRAQRILRIIAHAPQNFTELGMSIFGNARDGRARRIIFALIAAGFARKGEGHRYESLLTKEMDAEQIEHFKKQYLKIASQRREDHKLSTVPQTVFTLYDGFHAMKGKVTLEKIIEKLKLAPSTFKNADTRWARDLRWLKYHNFIEEEKIGKTRFYHVIRPREVLEEEVAKERKQPEQIEHTAKLGPLTVSFDESVIEKQALDITEPTDTASNPECETPRSGLQINLTLNINGNLKDAKEFANLIAKFLDKT